MLIVKQITSPGWDKRSDLVHWEDLEGSGPGALGRPRGIGWRGRWERGSGWGTHVNPWLFHFNVWQIHYNIKNKKIIKCSLWRIWELWKSRDKKRKKYLQSPLHEGELPLAFWPFNAPSSCPGKWRKWQKQAKLTFHLLSTHLGPTSEGAITLRVIRSLKFKVERNWLHMLQLISQYRTYLGARWGVLMIPGRWIYLYLCNA